MSRKTKKKNVVIPFIFTALLCTFVCAGHLCAFAADTGALVEGIRNTGVNIFDAIISISSITAGVAAAIALIQLLVVQNPQRIDRAKVWLIRIIIVFIAINGIGTILTFFKNSMGDSLKNDGLTTIGVHTVGGAGGQA